MEDEKKETAAKEIRTEMKTIKDTGIQLGEESVYTVYVAADNADSQ